MDFRHLKPSHWDIAKNAWTFLRLHLGIGALQSGAIGAFFLPNLAAYVVGFGDFRDGNEPLKKDEEKQHHECILGFCLTVERIQYGDMSSCRLFICEVAQLFYIQLDFGFLRDKIGRRHICHLLVDLWMANASGCFPHVLVSKPVRFGYTQYT